MASHFDWKSTILFSALFMVMCYGYLIVNDIDEKRHILRKAVQLESPVLQPGANVFSTGEEDYCDVIVMFSDKLLSESTENLSVKINSAVDTDFSVVFTDEDIVVLRFNKNKLYPDQNKIEISTGKSGKYVGNFNLSHPVVKDLIYCAL